MMKNQTYHHSKKTRKKMRLSHLGKRLSQTHIESIRRALNGRRTNPFFPKRGKENPAWKGGIYANNPKEWQRQYDKKYRGKNKERLGVLRKIWVEKNMAIKLATNKRWEQNHPEQIGLIRRARGSKRRALKKFPLYDGSVTIEAIKNMIINQDNKCNICKNILDAHYHLDHIYPVSLGGQHTISNIQILCPRCNLKKSNKTDYMLPNEPKVNIPTCLAESRRVIGEVKNEEVSYYPTQKQLL